jgi:hypothetical protein
MKLFKEGEREKSLEIMIRTEKRVEDLKQYWYFN